MPAPAKDQHTILGACNRMCKYHYITVPVETETCQTCSLSDWYPWSTCSESCGGGIQSRQRSLCCPVDVPYDNCLNILCQGRVTYNDTLNINVCNTRCSNGGVFDNVCVCQPGWTGRCCEIPCGEPVYGINCSQTCECEDDSRCDHLSGQCVKKESRILTKDGEECILCELRHWSHWGSCDQQCGGGLRTRRREVCCSEEMDYERCVREQCNILSSNDILEEGSCNTNCYNGGQYNETCQCKPGWTGKCCESQCDSGYYGDGCNSTCDCPSHAKCDKATGTCLLEIREHGHVEKAVGSENLYIILGVAIGVFVLAQTIVTIAVYRYVKGRRKAKIRNRLDKGKFWTQKANSNPVLDIPENHYEEIPFDTNGAKTIPNTASVDKSRKNSVKKGSFRKGSKKVNDTKAIKTGDMYQFLAQNGEDCGYQTLIDPDAIKYTAMYAPMLEPTKPGYMSMTGGTSDSLTDRASDWKEGGYLSMSNQLE